MEDVKEPEPNVPGVQVFSEDSASVFTAVPDVEIVKYVVTAVDNDANAAPGPSLNRYSLASWKMVVTNTGNGWQVIWMWLSKMVPAWPSMVVATSLRKDFCWDPAYSTMSNPK